MSDLLATERVSFILAHIGFEDTKEAGTAFENCLKYDYNHQKCRMYMENFRVK